MGKVIGLTKSLVEKRKKEAADKTKADKAGEKKEVAKQ